MPTRARLVVATLFTLGLVCEAEHAFADAAAGAPAPPRCDVALGARGPTQAVTLPANAPALLLVDSSSPGLTPTVSTELVSGTSRTSLGVAKTDTNGLLTVTLPSSTPSSHTLEMKMECSNGDEASTWQAQLTLTEPVAFPTTVGTLRHVPQDPPTGIDKIELDPSPGLRAFLQAARVQMSVEGTPSEKRMAMSSNSSIVFSAHTGDVCIENGELHRDKRIVRVSVDAAIAGVAELPAPATIDVPVDCGAIKWTAGISERKSPTSTPRSPSSSESSDPDGGVDTCAMRPGRTGSKLSLGALGVLALVALRRRRRSG